MKRWTEKEKIYSSGYLKTLQAYENLGTLEYLYKKLCVTQNETLEINVKPCFNGYYKTDDAGCALIKRIRNERGILQREINKKLGGGDALMSNIENGKCGLHPKDWKKLGKILGIKIGVIR